MGAIWCNPPYFKILPWMDKAAEQSARQHKSVAILAPEDMSVGWFSKALQIVDEVRVITDGRINDFHATTGKEQRGTVRDQCF